MVSWDWNGPRAKKPAWTKPGFRSPGSSADRPPPRLSIQAGDGLIRIRGQAVDSLKAARLALATVRAEDRVELVVLRTEERDKNPRELKLTVTAGEGF